MFIVASKVHRNSGFRGILFGLRTKPVFAHLNLSTEILVEIRFCDTWVHCIRLPTGTSPPDFFAPCYETVCHSSALCPRKPKSAHGPDTALYKAHEAAGVMPNTSLFHLHPREDWI